MSIEIKADSRTTSDPAVASSELLGAVKHTSRGFEIIDFKDRNGVACSLQASSIAEYEKPGTSAVWLGCDDANPRILLPGKGWTKVEWLPDTIADTRMHLNREQVAALIVHLQAWLDDDTFAPNESSSPTAADGNGRAERKH